MTLKQWIEFYKKKSGEEVEIKPHATFLFDESKGFMQYSFSQVKGEKVLLIDEVCGDGKYWENEALRIAKENECKKLITTTSRNLKAYQKRFPKTKLMAYVLIEEVE